MMASENENPPISKDEHHSVDEQVQNEEKCIVEDKNSGQGQCSDVGQDQNVQIDLTLKKKMEKIDAWMLDSTVELEGLEALKLRLRVQPKEAMMASKSRSVELLVSNRPSVQSKNARKVKEWSRL